MALPSTVVLIQQYKKVSNINDVEQQIITLIDAMTEMV